MRRLSGSSRPTTLQQRGWSATSCCATCVAGGWVGELVQFYFRTSSQAGGSFGVTGSVGGLGSTQIQAEPGESHGRGATSLPAVKYPADLSAFLHAVVLFQVGFDFVTLAAGVPHIDLPCANLICHAGVGRDKYIIIAGDLTLSRRRRA